MPEAKRSERTEQEDKDLFRSVLSEAIFTLDRNKVDYVVIGGLAAVAYGVPRLARDVDIFIHPDAAEQVQKILVDEAGFEAEPTDLDWLCKVHKHEVLIDLIYEIQNKMHLDQEMMVRSTLREVGDVRMRVVSPEDFVVMQAASHTEDTPHYWSNAMHTFMGADIDWDYLLSRAQYSPRRVLSLMIYAQGEDIPVPNFAVQKLYGSVYGA